MKLYLYDENHQNLHAEEDMGDLTAEQIALIKKVIGFLSDNDVVDGRYRCLTLAKSHVKYYDDGDPILEFQEKA